MGKIAFVFSGQGAQYSGMGKELYDISPAAKSVFDMADSIREGTSSQCFNASKEELSKTINTQPCLFAVELAAAESLKEKGITPDAVAGFSLGEITALTFSGVFSYEDGFKFVCKRAESMQKAAEKTNGTMAAVLKLSNEEVENICKSFKNVFPVNYNCKGQLVVAGEKSEIKDFCSLVKESGGRAIPLAVSGGFHSPFMDEASKELEIELENYKLNSQALPIYSNYTGELYGKNIKEQITMQVNHPVLWQKTIENMAKSGIDTFIEVGPGKTLCGLIKKIVPTATILNVENKDSLENTLNALGKGDN